MVSLLFVSVGCHRLKVVVVLYHALADSTRQILVDVQLDTVIDAEEEVFKHTLLLKSFSIVAPYFIAISFPSTTTIIQKGVIVYFSQIISRGCAICCFNRT